MGIKGEHGSQRHHSCTEWYYLLSMHISSRMLSGKTSHFAEDTLSPGAGTAQTFAWDGKGVQWESGKRLSEGEACFVVTKSNEAPAQ